MILLPAIFDSFRSLKDKTMKITFETSEASPEEVAKLVSKQNCFGYLAFKDEPFTDVEKEAIEALKTDFEDTGKTPGQRLRGVLYRMWEQNNERYEVFVDYYNAKMEKIINHYKANLL